MTKEKAIDVAEGLEIIHKAYEKGRADCVKEVLEIIDHLQYSDEISQDKFKVIDMIYRKIKELGK